MNTDKIDHISINDFFWIKFAPQMINFGFQGLPKSIHYTIAFSDKSSDINFHVTKETQDPKNKPKIEIVRMDKKLLQEWFEKILPKLSISFLNNLLQPLDIVELKERHNDNLGFISFESLKNTNEYLLTEQKLIDSFKEISRVRKKTRLKVEGNIEERLDNFLHLMN
jgi:hypothetical protein